MHFDFFFLQSTPASQLQNVYRITKWWISFINYTPVMFTHWTNLICSIWTSVPTNASGPDLTLKSDSIWIQIRMSIHVTKHDHKLQSISIWIVFLGNTEFSKTISSILHIPLPISNSTLETVQSTVLCTSFTRPAGDGLRVTPYFLHLAFHFISWHKKTMKTVCLQQPHVTRAFPPRRHYR